MVGFISGSAAGEEFRNLLMDPDRLFSYPDAVVLKQEGNTRTVRFSCQGREFLFKHFLSRGWAHSVRGLVRGSRAKRAAEKAELFSDKGIPTPSPVAFLERRYLWIPVESYICYEFLPGTENLTECYRRIGYSAFVQAGILEAVACDVAGMHEKGLHHGDLKWSNILVSEKQTAMAWLVDLDGAGTLGFARGIRIAEDLSRFLVDLVENMEARIPGMEQFVRAYVHERGLNTETAMRLLHSVEKKTQQKLRTHSRTRGHSLRLKDREITGILQA